MRLRDQNNVKKIGINGSRIYHVTTLVNGAHQCNCLTSPFHSCCNRARVGLSVGITVTMSVTSNKVLVVTVLTKNIVNIISLVLKAVR